jgi:type IV secretory pathway VirB4 component
MLNLREYRSRADRLADHLPWAALVAPGIVLNKDGSFQKTLRFRGPDLESATQAELLSITARANNVLRRSDRAGRSISRRSAARRCPIRPAAFPMPPPGWSMRSGAASSRPRAIISRAGPI